MTETKQKRKLKKKGEKKRKSAQRQPQATSQIEQQEPNLTNNLTYSDRRAASQNGIHETLQNGVHNEKKQTHKNGTKQGPSPASSLPLSNQASHPTRGRSSLKGLPANQIVPFNSDTMSQSRTSETVSQKQTSIFNGQSAWRKAGLLSQIVSQPAVARRKHTLEIADLGDPGSETEVYESTYM